MSTKTKPLTKQDLTKDEVKKIYNKTYYELSKQKNKYSERAKCIDCIMCGGSYCYYNKSRHNKTKRHIKAMNKLKDIQNQYK